MVAIMVAFSKRVTTHSSIALVVAIRSAIQTSFAKKMTWSQDCDNCFLSLLTLAS